MRIGHGYDVHRLVEGRKCIIGGVHIPHEKGLLGHSDADVLTHAVMDALLGAAALGDIGHLFPDSDAAFAGIDSMVSYWKKHPEVLLVGIHEPLEDSHAVQMMAVGPPKSPYRWRFQTTLRCCGQKPWY